MRFKISNSKAARLIYIIAMAIASILFAILYTYFFLDRLHKPEDKMIDETAALEIAKKDAIQVYRDISIYKVIADLRGGKWYVDYDLTGEAMAGGGPHYIISATTGDIVERRYEQ